MKIKTYLTAVILTLAFDGMLCGCTEAEDLFDQHTDGNVSLTLSMPGQLLISRADATELGNGNFNENTITTVDLFLYPIGTTGSNALIHRKLEPATPTNPNQTTYTLNASISMPELRALFPDNATSCEAYAITNLPADVEIPATTDIESLKKIELSCAAFGTSESFTVGGEEYCKQTIPTNFVMSGESSGITLANGVISGNIDVYRAASKVSIELTKVEDTFVDENNVEWTPQKGAMTARLKHGQKDGYVDYLYRNTGDFISERVRFIEKPGNTTHYITDVPFYSYTNDWSGNVNSRTSITVCVKWYKSQQGLSSTVNTYYDIPINDVEAQLIRNTHYQIQLSIGIMGSLNEDEPLKLTNCSYIIVPWITTNAPVNTNLSQVRYLVVNETKVYMENIISRMIQYSSSHDIEIVSKKLEKMNLSGTTATYSELDPDGFRVVINNAATTGGLNYFTVEHDLKNYGNEESDYTEYRMTFRVRLKQYPDYYEDIVVTQVPMVFAEAEKNSLAGTGWPPNNINRGWMFVNGDYQGYQNNGRTSLGGANGISSQAGNKNPNRYIINATSISNDKFVIGDPRLIEVNNALTGDAVTTASSNPANWAEYNNSNLYPNGKTPESWWSNNYTLQFYHPTEESERTRNMISPQFMIASSYGVCSEISKQAARRRCASYQEDGYPAGRWRVPTQAEVMYIVQLSAWGIIPHLFGYVTTNDDGTVTGRDEDATYWCANGQIEVNAGKGTAKKSDTTSNTAVRCVYDTWYWKDTCTKNVFTWGDKQTFYE